MAAAIAHQPMGTGMPRKGMYFRDFPTPSRAQMQGYLQEILNMVQAPIAVDNNPPVGFRTTQVIEDLGIELATEPILLGYMRQGLDEINTSVTPAILTDATEFNTDIVEFGNTMPNPSAPMGIARMVRMKQSSRKSRATKFDLSFEIDGEIARKPQGVAMIAQFMRFIAGSFDKHLAFMTITGLLAAGLERRAQLSMNNTTRVTEERHYMNHNRTFAAMHKSMAIVNADIADKSRKIYDLLGTSPNVLIIPREKDAIVLQSKHMTELRRGGQKAADLFWGDGNVRGSDENILGTLFNKKLFSTPSMPDSYKQSMQLGRLVKVSRFGVFGKDQFLSTRRVKITDVNKNNYADVTLKDLLKGLQLYESFNATNADHVLSYKYTLVRAAYSTLLKTAGGGQQVGAHYVAYADFFNAARQVMTGGMQVNNGWSGQITGLYDRFLAATRVPNNEAVVELAKFNGFNGIRDQFEQAGAAGRDALINRLVRNNVLFDVTSFDFGNRNAEFLIDIAELDATNIPHYMLFCEMLAHYGDVIGLPFSMNNMETRSAVLGGLGNEGQRENLFFVFMRKVSRPVNTDEVVILNLKKLYPRLQGRHVIPEFALGRETYYTEARRAPGTLPLAKLDIMLFSETTYLEKRRFLVLGCFELYRMLRGILMVSGERTAFSTFSSPVISASEDSQTFVQHYHVSKRCGFHPRDTRGIVLMNDLFYDGYISGATAGIMTMEEIDMLPKQRFTLPRQDSNSLIVIPIGLDELKSINGFNVAGRVETANVELEKVFSYQKFWNEFDHFVEAHPETYESENQRGEMAKFVFPMGYKYYDANGNECTEEGGTPHGPNGEGFGCKDVRTLGDRMYPGADTI